MPDLTAYEWNELSPATAMGQRFNHRMIWDGTRAVLFGGQRETSPFNLSDTWEFDGTDWNDLSPATTPHARRLHSMVWDGSRILMFGGEYTSGAGFTWLNDTWEFVGGDWNQLSPSTSPSVRSACAMVWDGSRVLLHGGVGSPSGQTIAPDETWEFVAGDWNQLSPANTPEDIDHTGGGRFGHALVWDGSRAVTFSGVSDPGGGGGQFPAPPPASFLEAGGATWVFQTGTWSQPSPATEMPAKFSYPMAITDDDQTIMVYGGDISRIGDAGQRYEGRTWQFDGTTWEDLSKFGPGSRGNSAMVWDTINNRFILHGGAANSTRDALDDTWEFAPTVGPAVEFVSISHTFGLGD